MLAIDQFTLVCVISVTAFVFSDVLSETGMIFNWYFRKLDRMNDKGMAWLAYPLGYCSKCFAGQIALWFYAIKYYEIYDFTEHITFVVLAIFFAYELSLLNNLFKKITND